MSIKAKETVFEAALDEVIRDRLLNTFVSIPGEIVEFNSENQTAKIQITIERKLDGISSPIDILEDVPVVFSRSGGYALTMPVNIGDSCHVIFSDRSLDIWLDTGVIADSGDSRIHALSDGIAYLGLSAFTNSLPAFSSTQVELRTENGDTKLSMNEHGFDMSNSTQSLFDIIEELLTLLARTKAVVLRGSSRGSWDINTQDNFDALLKRFEELKL